MQPDRLSALVAFARVAHHSSFTRAAAELGVSPSALSQTVRALETHLDVRLLARTTRKVGLTELGARFLARIQPGLDAVASAVDELGELRGVASGLLRVTLPRLAHDLVVAPVLADFIAAHPQVRVELRVDDALLDLVAGGYDAGIRLGESLAQDMTAVRISGEQRQLVVGSPAYLRKHGRPRSPEDLRDHACINYRYVTRGSLYRWEFERHGREIEIEVDGPLISNDYGACIDAARRDIGLAIAFEGYVAEDLRRGRLVAVLEEWCAPFPGFYLYFPTRAQLPLKLRVFADFLTARAGTALATRPQGRPRPRRG